MKGKIKKWFHKKVVIESIKTLLMLPLMLLAGIILDILYWKGIIDSSLKMITWLVKWNISYSRALEILGGSFGIVVTILSMYITMNNNILERYEKKVYGIPRAKLKKVEKMSLKYTRRMCLLAPLFMLLFLNINFCISGYWVLGYCIVFLLRHYYRQYSSFSDSLNEVVALLKGQLSRDEAWTREAFSEYQILLECIGKSAEDDNNWTEIEIIYDNLYNETLEYDYVKRYRIYFSFTEIVFWRKEKRNWVVPMRVLHKYIGNIDINLAGLNNISEDECAILWGMLMPAVCRAEEGELIEFLHYFLNFGKRSIFVLRKTQEQIKVSALEEQAGIMLILVEYRLRRQLPETEQIVEQLRVLWEHGRYAFRNKESEWILKITILVQSSFEENRLILEKAVEEVKDDCCNGTTRSLIRNIIAMEMRKQNE